MRSRYVLIVLVAAFVLSGFGAGFFYTQLKQRVEVLHAITLKDPLFYSPEVNAGELARAVEMVLRKEAMFREELKYLAGRGSSSNPELIKKIAENGLLPKRYLKSLPASVAATERFLSSPSVFSTARMFFADWRSAHSFAKEADTLYEFVREANKSEVKRIVFELMGSRVDNHQIENDFRLISQNGRQLKEEVKSRITCFLGGECQMQDASQTEFRRKETWFGTENPPTPPLAKEGMPEISDFTLLSDTMVSAGLEDFERSGPYLIESGCFPERYVPWYIFRNKALNLIIFKQAHENHYNDLEEIYNKTKSPLLKRIMNEGVIFESQIEGTYYRCLDLKYWGELATLDYFSEKTNNADITSLWQLDERDSLILQNKLIDLPLMWGWVGRVFEIAASLIRYADQTETKPIYVLGIRTVYSLAFNTFSRSVWRMAQEPRYFAEGNVPLSLYYKTYHDLSQRFSDEEILRFHKRNTLDLIREKPEIFR